MDKLKRLVLQEVRKTFAERIHGLLNEKLLVAGVDMPAEVREKYVEHLMSGSDEAFVWNECPKHLEDVTLTLSEEELERVLSSHREFLQNELPKVVTDFIKHASADLRKSLVAEWPAEYVLQQAEYDACLYRLEQRWGEALDLLRLLLSVAKDTVVQSAERNRRSKAKRNRHLWFALLELQARACQVTSEIIVLIENGYADGAIARWRTLHEVGVVASVLAEYGDEAAERYLAHEIVDVKHSIDEEERRNTLLKRRPIAKRHLRNILDAYNAALKKYGKDFDERFGWASKYLNKRRPTFVDLERIADQAILRSDYKLASHNVHATSASITCKLGVPEGSQIMLAGASNFGLAEPGGRAATTLATIMTLHHASVPKVEDVIVMQVMADLAQRTTAAFGRADRQLRREVKNE